MKARSKKKQTKKKAIANTRRKKREEAWAQVRPSPRTHTATAVDRKLADNLRATVKELYDRGWRIEITDQEHSFGGVLRDDSIGPEPFRVAVLGVTREQSI